MTKEESDILLEELAIARDLVLNKELHPKFIAGPCTLSLHYNEEYQLTVYTFGEHHTTTDYQNVKDVMPIEDFLHGLIHTASSFIDIYVELKPFECVGTGQRIEYIKYIERCNEPMSLNKIGVKLKEYIVPHTRHLVRLHYTDIRQGQENHPLSLSELMRLENLYGEFLEEDRIKELSNYLSSGDKGVLPTEYEDETSLGDILKILSSPDIEVYQQYLIDQITLNPYLVKELNKSFLKDKIIKFGIECILQHGHKHRPDILRVISLIFNPSTSNKRLKRSIVSLVTYSIFINSCIVDMYTLARIFKKFNVGKSNQPISPRNIIIYAGDGHSRNCRKFLASIGSKEIAHVGARDSYTEKVAPTCVDLSDFSMPFFRN